MASDLSNVPQPWLNAIAGALLAAISVLGTVLAWVFRGYAKKIDDHLSAYAKGSEESKLAAAATAQSNAANFVTVDHFKETTKSIASSVAELVTRAELINHFAMYKDAQQQQFEQLKEAMIDLKAASEKRDTHSKEFRDEMRTTIGTLSGNVNTMAVKVEGVATTVTMMQSSVTLLQQSAHSK